MSKDPFRTAEHWTPCKKCGHVLGWNTEDGLTGQSCSNCGNLFSGKERSVLSSKKKKR